MITAPLQPSCSYCNFAEAWKAIFSPGKTNNSYWFLSQELDSCLFYQTMNFSCVKVGMKSDQSAPDATFKEIATIRQMRETVKNVRNDI